MSPTSNNAGMELPAPVEAPKPVGETKVESPKSAEVQPLTTLEKAPNPPVAIGAVPPMSIPLPTFPQSLASSSSQTDDDQALSINLAQDKDLIEKEWINKAKAIVEKTRDDPYKQTEDLTLLKADYMKKQFNKTVKLNK